jgi:hypothetical protein
MAKGMTLEQFTEALRSAWGSALQAVVLYGSQAAPGATLTGSDYNVLVVVTAADAEALLRVADVVTAWRGAGHPPPMTMTVAEWRGSADVFPIEYADILARHRVLFGTFDVAGVHVVPADLRHQLEFEARGKVLQLRAGVLATAGTPEAQVALLARSVSSFTTISRALLRLHQQAVPDDAAAVVRAAAAVARFDAAPVLAALSAKRGERPVEPGRTVAGYLTAAEAVAAYLDSWSSAT